MTQRSRSMISALVFITIAGGLGLVFMGRWPGIRSLAADRKGEAARIIPRASVSLLGGMFTTKGQEWPGLAGLDEPCHLTVALPSGRRLRLPVKQVILHDEKGTVTDINTLPLKRL